MRINTVCTILDNTSLNTYLIILSGTFIMIQRTIAKQAVKAVTPGTMAWKIFAFSIFKISG